MLSGYCHRRYIALYLSLYSTNVIDWLHLIQNPILIGASKVIDEIVSHIGK